MPEANVTPTKTDPKMLGQRVALGIIIATVLVAIMAIWTHDYRPETDDATLRANFIGVAPHASGISSNWRYRTTNLLRKGISYF